MKNSVTKATEMLRMCFHIFIQILQQKKTHNNDKSNKFKTLHQEVAKLLYNT